MSEDEHNLPNSQQEQGKALEVKTLPDILITSPSDRSSFSSEGSSYSDFKYGGSKNTKFKAPVKAPEERVTNEEQGPCDTQFTFTVPRGAEDSPHAFKAVTKEGVEDLRGVKTEASTTNGALSKTQTNTDDDDVTDEMPGNLEMVVTGSKLSSTSGDEEYIACSSVAGKPVALPSNSASELDLFERTEAILNDPYLSDASTVAAVILSSKQNKLPENREENFEKEKNSKKLIEISIARNYKEQEEKDMGRIQQRKSLDEIAVVGSVDGCHVPNTADDKEEFFQQKSVEMHLDTNSKQAEESTVSFSVDSSEESDYQETVGLGELNPTISHSNSFPSCILSQIKKRDMERSHSLDSLKNLQSVGSKKGGNRFIFPGKSIKEVPPRAGSPLGNRAAALLSELQSQISSFSPQRRSELETDNNVVRRYSEPSTQREVYCQSGLDVTQATASRNDEISNSQETYTDQTSHQGLRNDGVEIPVVRLNEASDGSNTLDSNNNGEPGSSPLSVDKNEPSRTSNLEPMNENGTNPPSLFEGRSGFIIDDSAEESTDQSQLASLEQNSTQSRAKEVSLHGTLPAKGREGFSMPLFEDLENTSFTMDDSLDFQKNSNDDQDD